MEENTHASIVTKHGPIPYRLTNDYMFRAVFQTRPKALEGLCRSVLHLNPEDTVSVTIRNPILLGKTPESKSFIMDIEAAINNSLFINLEMQVVNYSDWTERSLGYTSRSFDNLNRGENYIDTTPVVHVGFLDFTLFPDDLEFFATYRMSNVKTHKIYSDKFTISVVDLKHIELATEEDRKHGIDLWARVFKATSWEEINMLAKSNEYLKEAVSGVIELSEDEQIRQCCQARADYELWERRRLARHQRALDEKDRTIASLTEELAKQATENSNLTDELAKQAAEIAALKAQLADTAKN